MDVTEMTDSKKKKFALIIRGEVLDMTIQKNVKRFCTRESVAETCFSHWGYIISVVYTWSVFQSICIP